MRIAGHARLAALGAAVLWGTTGTAQALGPVASTPATVGAVRIAVGAAGLGVLARLAGGTGPWRRWLAPGARAATLTGMLGVAAYQMCFFAAVTRTGVAVGTAVAIGSAPALTGLLALVVLHERPEERWTAATALAVAGTALLLLSSGGPAVDASGVLLALGAGAAYALYTLASKALLDRGHAPPAVMAVLFGGGAVLLAPVLVLGQPAWLATTRGVALAGYLGVVTVALAYLLFAHGLVALRAATVATLSLAEPLTAGFLGIALLGERPGPVATAGALLVLAGLLLLAVRPRRRVPR